MIAATSEGNITSAAREILENDPAFVLAIALEE
jgi:hypothetical protein